MQFISFTASYAGFTAFLLFVSCFMRSGFVSAYCKNNFSVLVNRLLCDIVERVKFPFSTLKAGEAMQQRQCSKCDVTRPKRDSQKTQKELIRMLKLAMKGRNDVEQQLIILAKRSPRLRRKLSRMLQALTARIGSGGVKGYMQSTRIAWGPAVSGGLPGLGKR